MAVDEVLAKRIEQRRRHRAIEPEASALLWRYHGQTAPRDGTHPVARRLTGRDRQLCGEGCCKQRPVDLGGRPAGLVPFEEPEQFIRAGTAARVSEGTELVQRRLLIGPDLFEHDGRAPWTDQLRRILDHPRPHAVMRRIVMDFAEQGDPSRDDRAASVGREGVKQLAHSHHVRMERAGRNQWHCRRRTVEAAGQRVLLAYLRGPGSPVRLARRTARRAEATEEASGDHPSHGGTLLWPPRRGPAELTARYYPMSPSDKATMPSAE